MSYQRGDTSRLPPPGVLTYREAMEALLRGEEVVGAASGRRYALVGDALCDVSRPMPRPGALLPYLTPTPEASS